MRSDTPSRSSPAHAAEARPAHTATGWAALFSGGNAARSITLSAGVVLHAINLYMAMTVLPSAVRDIGGMRYYTWNTSLFVAASIVGSSLSARALGRFGPRAAYGIAVAIFATGAVLCATAPAMPPMLAGRVLQGIGSGLLVSMAYAVIRLVFPPALWPRAMSMLSSMWGVATLIGPAIGGLFAGLGVWRAAFWTLAALSIPFAMLATCVLPRTTGAEAGSFPGIAWRQIALMVGSVLCLAVAGASPHGWENLAGCLIVLGLFACLAHLERQGGTRLLPARALVWGSSLAPLYALMGCLALTVEVIEIFAPLFLQDLHRQPPLTAGYLSVLMAAGWSTGSILNAGAPPARVARALVAAPALGLAGILFLAFYLSVPTDGAWQAMAPVCVTFLMVGLGVGTAWPHLLTRVLLTAQPADRDLASASLTTVQLYTTALAGAWAGMIANIAGLADPGGMVGAERAAFWVFALFAIMPAMGILTGCSFLKKRTKKL
ncbi:MFS transporter [Gluconacetobacter asukensis]|uniref:MFS transporter n=1 Tax=Gluconacetobacter asukensis TaxID=1017181 RepID=A0A7W4NYI7_9PROT|nr:MFS transporter [Gluconacetobacter asukensis]MBB2170892.1 MFS transporter [Gluconacetobacter asukensis]